MIRQPYGSQSSLARIESDTSKIYEYFTFQIFSFVFQIGEDSKSNNDDLSEEDESVNIDGNSSTSTIDSQTNVQQDDHQSSSFIVSDQYDTSSSRPLLPDNSKSKSRHSSIKRSLPRRRGYNLALPPVAEHVDDEETGDDFS